MDARLSRMISEHNLDAHLAKFASADIDFLAMAALSTEEIDELAFAWQLPLGAKSRLRELWKAVRSARNPRQGLLNSEIVPLSSSDQELVDLLPTPFARAAAGILRPTSASTNTDVPAAMDVLLRGLALICQADYFHSGDWYDLEINESFSKLDNNPSYTTWSEFVGLCVRSAKRNDHACFLRELSDTWRRCENEQPIENENFVFDEFGQQVRRGGKIGMMGWLISRRNAVAHNVVSGHDLALAETFRQRCVDLYREYRWIGKYELWVGSVNCAYLLQGLRPRLMPSGPEFMGSDRSVVLRRPRNANAREWKHLELRLPPLLLPAADVPLAAGDAAAGGEPDNGRDAEVIIFNKRQKDIITYTSDPFAPNHVSRQIKHTLIELQRLQSRKGFPRVGRGELDREEVGDRIRAASERTLRLLETSGKFRQSLHVERRAYEPRLASWIHSTVPLLGLAAEAGAGKTGILSSIVQRWIKESTSPVLFVLANQHQTTSDVDRIVQDALFLGPDVGVVDVAKLMGGLVVALDGLNEHPGREDLIHRICSLAQASLESVGGTRFAVTWRTNDDRWISDALERPRLWWSPEEPGADSADCPQCDAPEPSHSGSQGAQKGRARGVSDAPPRDKPNTNYNDPQSAISAGPLAEGFASMDQGDSHIAPSVPTRPGLNQRKDEQPRERFVRIGPLTAQECSEVWRRYREAPELRLSPAFDWQDVQHRSPELSRQLLNPLWMRMLMECYHERTFPEEFGEADVFAEYLERIRGDYRAHRASELLKSLGKLMFRKQSIRVTLEELEQECWDLVHPREGLSALPALERRGVLSSIDGRSYTFAVERLAEQVIGEHIASTEFAETGRSLAALAVQLVESRFAQAHGAAQVALHQRMRSAGPVAADAYLFEFIDHCPSFHAVLAASALERRIEAAGDAAAASLVEQLLEDPTPSDLVAASGAARRLSTRGLGDLAFAFLTPFVTPERLSAEACSLHYRELLVEYVDCVGGRLAIETDQQDFWFDSDRVTMALDALRGGNGLAPSVEADRLLGLALVSASSTRFSEQLGIASELLLAEAVEVAKRRLQAAVNESNPSLEDDARHQLSDYLRLLAECRDGSSTDQENLLIEALNIGQRIRNPDSWNAAAVLWDLARIYEDRKDFDQALLYLRDCSSLERRQGKWWHACQTESKISDVLQELGRHDDALRAQVRAMDFARASGSPRHFAMAQEWLGDTFRRADRLDEAMEAYQRSLATGLGPPRADDWTPSSVRWEIAKVHMRRGEVASAIESHRTAVEEERDGSDRWALATALEHLGRALHEAGRFREAIDEFIESHEVGSYPEPLERWKPQVALHWQARCHQRLGEHGRAIEIRRSLVEFQRQAGDRHLLCQEIDWLACALRDARRFDEAAIAFGEAYEVGMTPTQVEGWHPSGILYRHSKMCADRGDYEAAIRLCRHAESISRNALNRARHAADLENLGDALRGAQRFDEALLAYRESFAAGMHPEPALEWSPRSVLNEEAETLSIIGDRSGCLAARQRAVDFSRRHEKRRHLAVDLEYLGDALQECGHLEDAALAFAESFDCGMHPDRLPDWNPGIPTRKEAAVRLEIGDRAASDDLRRRAVELLRMDVERYRALGHRKNLADALEYLGDSLREAGSAAEALRAYRESFEVGMSPERAPEWSPRSVQIEEARLLSSLADHEGCVVVRQRLVEFSREDGDRRNLAIDLEHLGHALRDAGQPDQAIAMYQESHQVGMNPEPVPNWNPGVPLRYQADLRAERGEEAEALRLRYDIVEIARARQNRHELTIALEYLGDALQECGHLEDAAVAFAESFQCGMHPDRLPDWNPGIPTRKEAGVRLELGDRAAADELRRRAVEVLRTDVERYRALGDRKNLADALEYLGDSLREAGSTEEALRVYRESFEVGMSPERAPEWSPRSVQIEEARLLSSLADHEGCVVVRQRLVEFSREDGDRRNLAIDLEYLGHALRDAGQPDQAIAMYQESHQVGMNPEPVPNWNPGISLRCQAELMSDRGEKVEALQLRHTMVNIARGRQSRRELAIALECLGDALRDAGSAEEALLVYHESFEVGMSPERAPEWSPHSVLGEEAALLASLSDHEGCVLVRRRLVEFSREDGDRRNLAIDLEHLGRALRDAGQPDQALAMYQESHQVGINPEPVQNWNPGISLRCQAELMSDLGEKVEALRLRHAIVNIARGRPSRRELAIALKYLGDALREAGSAEEALSAYRESFEVGMSPERAPEWSPRWVLSSEAALLASLADHDGCVSVRQRLVEFSLADGDRRYLAIDLEHLGHALRDAGQPDQAIAVYQESHQVGMNPEPVQNWNPGVSLRFQAELMSDRGEKVEALRLRHDIVAIARARQDRHELTIALEYLGDALQESDLLEDAAVAFAESFHCGMHPDRLPDWNPGNPTGKEAAVRLGLGNREAADELHRRSLELLRMDVERYRALGDRKNLADALEYVGDALRKAGSAEAALSAYRESFEVGMSPERAPEWSPRSVQIEEARLLSSLADHEGCVLVRQRLVEFGRADGDRRDLAIDLECLGDALREAGSAEEALSAYRESFEVGMSPERAPEWSPRSVQIEEARLLSSLADHEGCVLIRRRLVELSRADGDRRDLAIDLEHLGHALRDAGQPDQAIAMYQESHQVGMNPEPIQNWNPGVSLRYQAILLAERGEEAEALRLCHELVAIARARQNRQELAIALECLGDALREAGSAEEALRVYRESFEVGMSPERAPEWSPRSVLAEEARLLSSLGDYVGGVAVWRRVVEFARQDGDRRELAIDLEALADALRQAGQSVEAMQAYLEAFDVGTTPPVRIGGDAARPLLEVGLILGMSGDADGSLQFLRRAVEIARGGGSSANAPLGSVVLLRASRALGAILSSAGMVIAAVEEMDPDSQIALAVARGREGSHELLSATADWWGTQAECLEAIGDRHEAESSRRRERRIRDRLTGPR